jgi:hypothetical protein
MWKTMKTHHFYVIPERETTMDFQSCLYVCWRETSPKDLPTKVFATEHLQSKGCRKTKIPKN